MADRKWRLRRTDYVMPRHIRSSPYLRAAEEQFWLCHIPSSIPFHSFNALEVMFSMFRPFDYLWVNLDDFIQILEKSRNPRWWMGMCRTYNRILTSHGVIVPYYEPQRKELLAYHIHLGFFFIALMLLKLRGRLTS